MYIYIRNIFRKLYTYAENMYISSQINRHLYNFYMYYYNIIPNYSIFDRNVEETKEIEMV